MTALPVHAPAENFVVVPVNLFPNLKGIYVNKSELIEAIAKSADISKASAEKALDGTLNAIKTTLKKVRV